MEQLRKEELYQVTGGTSLSSAMVNSFTSLVKALFAIGQNLGSSLRRIHEDMMCPLK